MDDYSVHQSLIPHHDAKKAPFLVSSTKWILKILIWVIFVTWVAFIFLFPTQFGGDMFEKWIRATNGTLFGITGSIFLLLSGPVVAIAFLCIAHLIIAGEEEFHHKKRWNRPKFRLWTFPVLVDGPLGVVSASELIGVLLFVAYIFWAVYSYTIRNLSLISEWEWDLSFGQRSIWMLELTGLRLGMIGLFCLAFLFLPIARGSVLLRFVDIPFEHATRYHVWLGHLTMILFTLHGLFYVIGWQMQGILIDQLLEWRDVGVANLAGVISLLSGLLMWVTSLQPVRRWNFELFFYTHQLYVVFVVFLALHVGDFIFTIAAGGIFLFMLDRFLRFWQSRRTVDVISANCLPCGTVELVLSKPKSLRYNALSFVFLQIGRLSWLQWHPFSVSSSPLDGKYHMCFLIKVLGTWTDKLKQHISNKLLEAEPHRIYKKITASVEGPYGHESPYHLMYENLILVAGGIGISPFLAILSDVLHRTHQGRPCLPRNILVVWAIKKSDELSLFSAIDMDSICPNFSSKLNLEILTYVTRESEPMLEDGKFDEVKTKRPYACPVSKGIGMSVLVGTGDNVWAGIYVIVSAVGLVILVGLLDVYYINPYGIITWWYKGLLFIVCMVASVLIFGGLVVAFWHLWEAKTSAKDREQCEEVVGTRVNEQESDEHVVSKTNLYQKNNANVADILYGTRPDFREIFGSVGKRWGYVDVGVIVCGPPTLQTSVAKEIRFHNLRRGSRDPILHFNSHSFDL
ncbi:hypothetical protein K2173_015439 [Erythroxylum novogranatense]|uniref:ferric-chelate reductase (NADH) n=1 Tax=Erythroxylum novogranatense TaxID=1862640 RepID=A0AAV8SRK8_9ROSI|nr:hypothetical protein K2173_015439 [Erythroxylum novogranatense]